MDAELISVKSLSQMLDVSEKTIQDWLYRQRKSPVSDPIPYYKLGGVLRFHAAEIRAWYGRRRVRASANV